MARHDNPDDTSFRRTLLRSALGGVVALVIAAGIAAVAARTTAPGGTPAVVATDPSPDAVVVDPTEVAQAQPTDPPTEEADDVSAIRVQVLHGAFEATRGNDAAEVLQGLGYTVALTDEITSTPNVTTVYYNDGFEADAQALVDRDDRFKEIRPNQEFQADADLHVVVGSDWPGS